MKSLANYICETLEAQINEAFILFKPTAKTAANAAKFEDELRSFLNNTKTRYSFNNKQDLQQFFKDFCDKSKINKAILKEFGMTDGHAIAQKIIDNKEKLEQDKWNLFAIKSFDESAREREYKAWKDSDDYVQGKTFNKDDYKDADEQTLTRTLVVYDRDNPGNTDTTLEYEFNGKRSKDNMHQVHMIRQDWCKYTGLNYYNNARECLLSYYLKKSDAELAKREIALTDDDLEEM